MKKNFLISLFLSLSCTLSCMNSDEAKTIETLALQLDAMEIDSSITEKPKKFRAVPEEKNAPKKSSNFHTVVPNKLYRSAQLSKTELEAVIKTYGIKTIINLRGQWPTESWWRDEFEVALKHHCHFHNILMVARSLTTRENLQQLLDLYDDLDSAPTPILIHCKEGKDRAGEAAALWLLEKEHQPKRKALEELSETFGHKPHKFPAKAFLIYMWPVTKNKKQRRKWLNERYNPYVEIDTGIANDFINDFGLKIDVDDLSDMITIPVIE